ncbi:MAG TPA: hypothetical protein VGK23_11490 [Methanomassiliicoccales archaeon]
MSSILEKGQTVVAKEIEKVRNQTYDLALRLGSAGLNGSIVRDEINRTLTMNPYAVDILTFNKKGIVQAIEPERFRYLEGVDLSGGNKTSELLKYKVSTMSNTFSSRGITRGSGYACPVFGANGTFIGAVSMLYDVGALMNATLPSLTAGTEFTWFAIQLDGTEIYDTDVSQIGMNTLTDPNYVNFTQLVALGWRSVNETNGYGTYSFVTDLGTKQVVSKECFWTTVGAETIQWRLFLVHPM